MARVSLSLLVLKARQVPKLRAFYGTLGIEWTEEQHGSGPVHYSGQLGETVLELYPLPEDGTAVDGTTRLLTAVPWNSTSDDNR